MVNRPAGMATRPAAHSTQCTVAVPSSAGWRWQYRPLGTVHWFRTQLTPSPAGRVVSTAHTDSPGRTVIVSDSTPAPRTHRVSSEVASAVLRAWVAASTTGKVSAWVA